MAARPRFLRRRSAGPSGVRPVPGGAAVRFSIRALDRTGALVREDGAVVRLLRLTPVDPRSLLAGDLGALQGVLSTLAAGLAPGASLQLHVEGRPGSLDGVPPELARPPLHLDVLLALPGSVLAEGRRSREALATSLREADAMRLTLGRAGLRARLLDGPDVAAVLLRRIGAAPDTVEPRPLEVVGDAETEGQEADAERAAADLEERLALLAPDVSPRWVSLGDGLEQVVHLAGPPTTTRPGWLLDVVPAGRPFALAVHVHGPALPERRGRRRGGEEPAPATDGIAASVYLAVLEPGPDASLSALAETADAVADALGEAAGASVHRGEFRQDVLWSATLPLADDAAARTHPFRADQLADTVPVFACGCSCPRGLPFAIDADDARLQRLDPFDPAQTTAALLVTGARAREEAATLLDRLAASGLRTTAAAPVAADLDPWAVGGDAAFLVDLHRQRLAQAGHALDAPGRRVLAAAVAEVLAAAEHSGATATTGALADAVAARDEQALATLADALAGLPPLTGPAAHMAAAEHAVRTAAAAPPGAALVGDVAALAASPPAADWLARTVRCARGRRCFVVATADDPAALAAAPAVAAAFAHRLALRPSDDGTADWDNGARGRAPVRLALPATTTERTMDPCSSTSAG